MANLSNINNKFLVTTGGNVLIGQTAAVGTPVLQVTGISTFEGDVIIPQGAFIASQTSLTNPVARFTNTGVNNYDFTFPNNSTLQLGSNIGGDLIFKLANAGAGNFNLDVGGDATFAGDAIFGGTSFDDPNSYGRKIEIVDNDAVGLILNDTRGSVPMSIDNSGEVMNLRYNTTIMLGLDGATSNATFTGNITGVGATFLGAAASGAALVTIENNSGSTATSYGLLVKGGGNSSSGKTFEVRDDSGNTDLIVKGNGNVGINTTSPDATLELYNISQTSDGDGSATETLSGQDSLLLQAAGGGVDKTTGSITWRSGSRRRAMITSVQENADGDYQGIAFYTRGTDGPGDMFESMRISHSGNVIQSGTSPQYQFVTPSNYNFQIAVQENVSNALEITPSTAAGGTTFSTPAVIINSSGNVGIGTTSPSAKLNVVHTASTSIPALQIASSASLASNDIVRFQVNGLTNGFRMFQDASSVLNYTFQDGNVGIGTTTPAAGSQLTLRSSASTGITILSASNTGECFINFSDNDDANVGQIFYGHSPDRMAFRVGDDTRVTILGSNGNVGIGTTSPSGLLHLKGDTNSNGAEIYLQVNNNNTTDNLGAIHFGNNIDSTLSEILSQTSGANNSSSLIFSTSSTGTKAERMRIKSDGNILVADTRRIQFYNTDQYIGATSTNDLEIQAGDDINYRSNFSRFFSGTTEHCRVSGLSNQNNWIANGTGGKLGIGTTSPTAKLHVASSVNADVIFKLENTNTGTSAGARIELIDDEAGSGSGAGALRHSIKSMSQTVGNWIIESGSAAGQLDFSTVDSFIMRLDESQNVLIGKTSQGLSIAGIEAASNATLRATKNNSSPVEFNRLGTDGDIVLFYKNTAGKGSISITSSAVSYNTSSDYRLKEDLQDFTGLDMVSKIPVYDFKWKEDKSRSYGVMAHELQEVLPNAVSGDKDAEEMQGVDYSKIVPLLVKSIQELKAEIEILKNK